MICPGLYLLSVLAVGPNLYAAALAFLLAFLLVGIEFARGHRD